MAVEVGIQRVVERSAPHDERSAIDRSDAKSSTNVRGSAFEKVSAFRAGVLGGLTACNTNF